MWNLHFWGVSEHISHWKHALKYSKLYMSIKESARSIQKTTFQGRKTFCIKNINQRHKKNYLHHFHENWPYKVLKHRCWPCAEGKLLTFLIFRSKFVNYRLNCIANGLNWYTDWFMTAFSFLFFQNLVSPTFFFSS